MRYTAIHSSYRPDIPRLKIKRYVFNWNDCPMMHPEEDTLTEMVSVEPDPVVPLFVGHILDH